MYCDQTKIWQIIKINNLRSQHRWLKCSFLCRYRQQNEEASKTCQHLNRQLAKAWKDNRCKEDQIHKMISLVYVVGSGHLKQWNVICCMAVVLGCCRAHDYQSSHTKQCSIMEKMLAKNRRCILFRVHYVWSMVDIKVLCATASSQRMSWYCTCPADVEHHVIHSRFELSCAHQSDGIEHTLHDKRASLWPKNVLARHNPH